MNGHRANVGRQLIAAQQFAGVHFSINAARGTEVATGITNSTEWVMADGRLEALRRDLEARIRPLVPDLSDEEFAALIERMAQLQYKYEARRAEDFFDRQPPGDAQR